MRYSLALVAAIAASVEAHGLITQIQGANGVIMPGLSVKDGVPRDSPIPGAAEADTSIIRKNELGSNKASALGRTAAGPVSAAAAISTFLGGNGAANAGGNAGGNAQAAGNQAAGNQAAGNQNAAAKNTGAKNAGRGLLDALTSSPQGTKTPKGTVEMGVAKAAGTGAQSGLPTCSDDGTISMTYHQVNQDGAGPLTAQIDPTSGGTDPAAFQEAKVIQNVPGVGIGGLSLVDVSDFPVMVQMPAGMTCSGSVGGANNVCIVRMQNAALAGPFGGSAAFTQSANAQKRAVEYNLSKRHFARGILGKPE